MHRKLQTILPLAALTIFTNTSIAADLTIVPRVEAGFGQYTLEVNDSPFTPDLALSYKFQAVAPLIRFGLSGVYDRFYLDVYYHITGEATESVSFDPAPISETLSGDRKELNFTAGYKILENTTIFAGYRDSETTANGAAGTDYTFTHDGFTLGASYRFPITQTGGLTFTAGWAWLDAEIDTVFQGTFPFVENGDGDGLKFSVVWSAGITERLYYNISADYLRYDYDMKGSEGNYELVETDIEMRIGLQYIF